MSFVDSLTGSTLASTIGSVQLPDFTLNAGKSSSSANSKTPSAIPQTERLFTARSRGAFMNQNAGGDRGTRAFITLLTNNKTASLNRRGNDEVIGAPPSKLVGPGNPLDQAINGSTYGGYADFLLTGVQCSLDEKMQITETFGDGEVVYYFGRQPMMFSMSGVLIDSQDNDWFVQWLQMYGHVMRGSQLARNYELLKIVLPNMDIIGTMPHMSWQQDSANDVQIRFEFQFQAKQIIPRPVTMLGAPASNAANMINFTTADSFLSQQGINSIKSQAGAVLQTVQNPHSTIGDIGAALSSYGHGVSAGAALLASGIGPGRLSPPGSTGLSQAIDGITGGANSVTSSINDVFYSISANLAGIRASLFSPIYGVLTSLTKLVRNVMGDVASVFNSMLSPVADIVRDVLNVAGQAAGLVGLVNMAMNSTLGIEGIGDNGRTYLGPLFNTRGCVPTQPWTANMVLRQLLGLGRLPIGIGFMQGGASLSSSGQLPSKAALLSSGPPPTAQAGAVL